MQKTYQEMMKFETFESRFEYLKLKGKVGDKIFGGYRPLNQRLYKSKIWRNIRDNVIIRDNGCDLAIPEEIIFEGIYIHHINPITIDDIVNGNPRVFDMNNLICVSFITHNALHYGNIKNRTVIERKEGDTKLW